MWAEQVEVSRSPLESAGTIKVSDTTRKEEGWIMSVNPFVAVAVVVVVVVVATTPAKMSTVDRMNRERDWLRNRHRPHLIA